MQNQPILYPLPLPELEAIQRQWIREELQQFFSETPQNGEASTGPEEPVTANELARILHTTVENIHRQKARGNVPFRKMGGRTYFLLSEVVEAMKKGGKNV